MRKNLFLAVLLSWLIPGGGHYYLGKNQKALLYLIVLTIVFFAGSALAEFSNVSTERHPIYFFTTYIFIGSYTFASLVATKGVQISHQLKYGDLGCLYTAVACLLNLLLIIDVIALASPKRSQAR